MGSLTRIGFVGLGLAFAVSATACAMLGNEEETGNSRSDISHGRPGKGVRPVGPTIVPDADAEAPSARIEDLDGGAMTDEDASLELDPDASDASAPVDEDASSSPPAPVDEDAGLP